MIRITIMAQGKWYIYSSRWVYLDIIFIISNMDHDNDSHCHRDDKTDIVTLHR